MHVNFKYLIQIFLQILVVKVLKLQLLLCLKRLFKENGVYYTFSQREITGGTTEWLYHKMVNQVIIVDR